MSVALHVRRSAAAGEAIARRGFPRTLAAAAALLLAYIGLVPATRTTWWRIADVPVSTKDLALVAVAVIGVLHCFGRPRPAWPRRAAAATFWVFAYAFLSLAWSDVTGRRAAGMAFTVVTSASAAAVGYALARVGDERSTRTVLEVLTLAIAALTALYSAESVFDLGLRSASDKSWTDFGMQRVKGPLYGATVGGFVLVPALAFALERLLGGAASRLLWGAASLTLLVGVFGLGSRSALLALAAFVLLTTSLLKSVKYRLVLAVTVCVLTASAGAFVFSRATTERLVRVEDSARRLTWQYAARVVGDRDPLEQLVGSGYGEHWPWYLTDVESPNLYESGDVIQFTTSGETLYHPHSTVLLVGVELGVVGTALFAWLALACVAAVRRARRANAWVAATSGVLAATALAVFDLLVFKTPAVNACWWVYFFGTLRLVAPRPGVWVAPAAAAAPPLPTSRRIRPREAPA